MIIIKSKTTTSCLFLMLLSMLIFIWYDNYQSGSWWLSIHMWSVIRVVVAVLVAGLMVILVRTTIVTWITVLVMLAIVGKRRHVLAVEGRKITGDVAMHLLKVLVRKRSLVAVACATFFSSVAMGWVA